MNPKELWNEIYSTSGSPGAAYGFQPNGFLVESLEILMSKDPQLSHRGHTCNALCLAEGEGRNALYLAQLGFNAKVMDISSAALLNLTNEAASRSLTHKISTIAADLNDFDFLLDAPQGGWDIIISIFALTSGALRKRIRDEVLKSLKPGGYYILTGT